MAYTLPNLTDVEGGIEAVGGEVARQVNYAFAGVLFFIFMVIWISGYSLQHRRTGQGDVAMWGAIAGLITTAGSFVLFLYDNLVTIEVVVICLVITIISAIAFIMSSRD